MNNLIFITLLDINSALWTLCFAVGMGCFLTTLSRKLHLPTLVLLILGGFIFGPQVFNFYNPENLGEFLRIFISLSVAIILFEGGLTLNLKDFLQTSQIIRRLLSYGVLITWLGTALAVIIIFQEKISHALLMGSLVIVTGPTVIVPLLRRIRIKQKIANVLHWEGVLIDSIGVFVAILCFECIIEDPFIAPLKFLIRILSGLLIGSIGGYLIYFCMNRKFIPDNLINAFALASAIFIFGLTELILHEAGLLTVTIAGIIVGIKKPSRLKEIKAFKAEIVDLLIGLLFILLVGRLEFYQFYYFFEKGGLFVLIAVIFLIRPISVFICGYKSQINLKEKLLLSWIAPRGVVAASMASIFAISIQDQNKQTAELIEAFVYSVICATVLIQGMSSGLIARLLKLQRPAPNDWIIIGAHRFGRDLAAEINKSEGVSAVLLDTNPYNINISEKMGISSILCDGMEADELYEEEQKLFGAGYAIALTDNSELNQLLMQRWGEKLSQDSVYGWLSPENNKSSIIGQPIFESFDTPTTVSSEIIKGNYRISTIQINNEEDYQNIKGTPLFVIKNDSLKYISNKEEINEILDIGDSVIAYKLADFPEKNTEIDPKQSNLPL